MDMARAASPPNTPDRVPTYQSGVIRFAVLVFGLGLFIATTPLALYAAGVLLTLPSKAASQGIPTRVLMMASDLVKTVLSFPGPGVPLLNAFFDSALILSALSRCSWKRRIVAIASTLALTLLAGIAFRAPAVAGNAAEQAPVIIEEIKTRKLLERFDPKEATMYGLFSDLAPDDVLLALFTRNETIVKKAIGESSAGYLIGGTGFPQVNMRYQLSDATLNLYFYIKEAPDSRPVQQANTHVIRSQQYSNGRIHLRGEGWVEAEASNPEIVVSIGVHQDAGSLAVDQDRLWRLAEAILARMPKSMEVQ